MYPQAIFLHSPDQEFAAVGAITKIGYSKRFAMFKKFLMDNAHQKHTRNLFRWWNRFVFSFETSGEKSKEGDEGEGPGDYHREPDDWYAISEDNQPAGPA